MQGATSATFVPIHSRGIMIETEVTLAFRRCFLCTHACTNENCPLCHINQNQYAANAVPAEPEPDAHDVHTTENHIQYVSLLLEINDRLFALTLYYDVT